MQTQADLSSAGWRKSRHSNNGGDCVEVAKLDRPVAYVQGDDSE